MRALENGGAGGGSRSGSRPEWRAHEQTGFARIEVALEALRAGRPVLVLDDADRENEGDVILPGASADANWMAWTIRHTSGYICAPMPPEWADRLELPLMVPENRDPLRTAYAITCDAATGVSTGISAADRARTVRMLADPASGPGMFVRPGHVVPLRARPGGVLERRGHTEAAVDLCRLAGLPPVGAIGELVHDDGSMMRTPDVLDLGARTGLPTMTIADLVTWRHRHDRVEELAVTTLPTGHGTFRVHGYRDLLTGAEHLALISPRGPGGTEPLVRVHSECLTGDAFGSLRCDCGPQLDQALARIAVTGGMVVYLRGHEGRGVGLLDKLRAYSLQDSGLDTVDAQLELGLPVDDREYGAAAAILTALGVRRLALLTNNPDKVDALGRFGLEVARVERSRAGHNAHNRAYLRAKARRMGHAGLDVDREDADDIDETGSDLGRPDLCYDNQKGA